MHPESLGFQPQHTFTETYCPGCGNPESADEHGTNCPNDSQQHPTH